MLDIEKAACSFSVLVKLHFLSHSKRNRWLNILLDRAEVYFPEVLEGQVHWRRLKAGDLREGDGVPEWGLEHIRASEPVKSFFFSPRERVASFPEKLEPEETGERILFGVKNCDLLPLKVHQKMFLQGDFKDTFYEARLRNTLLVAADCPEPADTCFCNLVGRRPFAEADADIVLSVLEDGFLLEPLSDEGEELVRSGGDAIQPATEFQAAKREEKRRAAESKLAKINPKPWADDFAQRIWDRSADSQFWSKHAAACVECFGCLMTCPTCYCFLLYDKAKEKGMDRSKVWDACYMAAYARVGGGANPRSEFLKRFVNRFQCKFTHFRNAHGFYACSGCGRCFKACMGKIDIRDILGEI